jgi:hypothetical protein
MTPCSQFDWHQGAEEVLTLYARSIPNAVCVAAPEDEQVMLETCSCPLFSINRMKSASRWFHYTDIYYDARSEKQEWTFRQYICRGVTAKP